MLEELCKRIQHCCATFRRSRNKTNGGSCWLKSLTGFKLCAITSNNMQQGVQTDATSNIQQCLELLVNNVASVCTQPKMACYSFQKIKITILKKYLYLIYKKQEISVRVLLLSTFVLCYHCKETRPFLTFQDLESSFRRTCYWYRPVEIS